MTERLPHFPQLDRLADDPFASPRALALHRFVRPRSYYHTRPEELVPVDRYIEGTGHGDEET